ncbi:protein GVQW3 [Trichonephila clavipes]|nr:protein GVQW3 [Trichonephila clavipes]
MKPGRLVAVENVATALQEQTSSGTGTKQSAKKNRILSTLNTTKPSAVRDATQCVKKVLRLAPERSKSASKTYQLKKQIYGNCCLSTSNIFAWYKRFLDGRDRVEVDQRSGRPISSRTADIIEKVQNFAENDRCALLRLMEDSLSTNKETIRTILHEDMGKTKLAWSVRSPAIENIRSWVAERLTGHPSPSNTVAEVWHRFEAALNELPFLSSKPR